jgi:hypothetical protein
MKRFLTSLTLLLSLPAAAAVSQPHPAELDEQTRLNVCRSAPVQALRFIEVGEARLWRDNCVSGRASLQPPLLLEFAYRREVPGSAFSRAAIAMIERNISNTAFAALKPRIERFNSFYRDIGDGDTYQLRYLPDGQLELLLNNEVLAREQGHEFASAYLNIWFGPQPYSDRLKRQLLASE